jgi:chromosome segregation protein
MLAADSRISYKATKAPALYIESIEIKNAVFLSLEESLHFSPQLSVLIGGRGSGKSTLLEYIRYGLGISAIDGGNTDWDPTFDRRKTLLEKTLDNTSVIELTVIQDGVSIRLIRSHSNADSIVMHVGGQEKFLSIEDARSMFPVQAYSQGELSHLGDDKAEKRLFDLVTAPAHTALASTNKTIADVNGDIRRLLQQAIEYWRLESQRRKIDAQLITIKAGIGNIKQNLGGLEASTQNILDRHQIVGQTSRWFMKLASEYSDSSANLLHALHDHITVLENYLADNAIPVATPAQKAAAALKVELNNVSEAYRIAIAANEEFEQQQDEYLGDWRTEESEHNAEYSVALSKTEKHTADLQRLAHLEKQEIQEQNRRDELSRKMDTLHSFQTELSEKGGEYAGLQKRLRRLTKESAERLAELTDGHARAEILPLDDIKELSAAIVSLFSGSNVRTVRQEKLIEKFKTPDAVATWWKFLNEILAVMRWKATGLHETERRPELLILDDVIDENGLARFCEIIDVERVSRAFTAVARPRVKLLYRNKKGESDFSQASQGEKATILLNVLMRQSGGPLLLDQPEEDLDNSIVGEIVSAVHATKPEKQLIFATHNANLVVNGDAELVVNLASGSASQIGAIDLPVVRDAITQTMEGGKTAFELRRLKYNF